MTGLYWSACHVSRFFSKCGVTQKSSGLGWHWVSLHVEASPMTTEVSLLITAEWWTSEPGWIGCWFHFRRQEECAFCPGPWMVVIAEIRLEILIVGSPLPFFCFFPLLPPAYGLHSLREWESKQLCEWMTVSHSGHMSHLSGSMLSEPSMSHHYKGGNGK